jgi:PleD family two-component response regulator
MRPRILIIDEDPQTAGVLKEMLKCEEADISVEHDVARGLAQLAADSIDILFANAHAQSCNGLELFRIARQWRPNLSVIAMAAVE